MEETAVRRDAAWLWPAAIGLSTVLAVAVAWIALVLGHTTVFPHIFYIPIILAAYRYPRAGVPFTIVLAASYLVLVLAFTPVSAELLGAVIRTLIFIAIAAIVAGLAGALHAEQQKYRTMFEHTGAATALIRNDGTIAMVNREWQHLLGYAAEDCTGRPWQTILAPEDRERFSGVLPENSDEPFELHLAGRDGMPLDVIGTSGSVPDAGMAVLSFFDITDKKRMEETNLFLASIVASSDAMVTSQDLDGTILSWNRGTERTTGYSAGDVIGRPSSILVPPEREGEMAMILAKIRAGEHIEHFETVRVRKDGSRFDVYLIVSPIKNRAGAIIGASTITRDITDQKKAQRMLEAANEEANLYLDIMAHDINNANTVSMGYADYFAGALTGKEQEFAEKMLASVQKSAEIIRNVSTIRRLRQENGALSPIVLDEVIRDEIRLFSGSAITYGGCTAIVCADDLLSEVFTNCIGNAVKFGGADVTVTITVSDEDPGTVTVAIDDTGPGIPDDEKPGLFSRFSRGNTKKSGKGLGLFICRMLVQRYGGTIRADDRVSGSPGEGARIVFTLRRAPAAGSEKTISHP
ncbi:MAG: PAS domain S-box protein [Methanomicrobiales archaeon]|nr:PAS domain S-box protein [Methanomicrobiales archaeon]